MYEETEEIKSINEKLAKKISVRDLIQAKIDGKGIPQEFKQYQNEVLTLIPKFNEMLMEDQSCAMLMKGRIQVHGRLVSFNLIQIFTSFADFTDKLLREGTRSVN